MLAKGGVKGHLTVLAVPSTKPMCPVFLNSFLMNWPGKCRVVGVLKEGH